MFPVLLLAILLTTFTNQFAELKFCPDYRIVSAAALTREYLYPLESSLQFVS
jgi:hypothetical protein